MGSGPRDGVKFSRPSSGNAPLRGGNGRRIVAVPFPLRNQASPMLQASLALCILAVVGPCLSAGPAVAESGAPAARLAVLDFAYVDTSGEPVDQTAVHKRRLQAFMAALKRDLAAEGQFHLVALFCEPVPCADGRLAPAGLLRAAANAGATVLVIGGIHKQSTLVQWAKIQAIDIAADRVLFDRLFTFRGDSDEAWGRAEAFMSRELRAALAAR